MRTYYVPELNDLITMLALTSRRVTCVYTRKYNPVVIYDNQQNEQCATKKAQARLKLMKRVL